MTKFPVGGAQLEPHVYRRVSENGRRGEAILVVCTNGDNWYERSDRKKVKPAEKKHVDYIFKKEPQGTSVVREPPPY
jgi:hypothetical protein